MNKRLRYKVIIDEMKEDILESLSVLEKGFGMRKFRIKDETEIPDNILTVLLKELKHDGKIEIIMIWNEETGLPNGSGYCLANQLMKN